MKLAVLMLPVKKLSLGTIFITFLSVSLFSNRLCGQAYAYKFRYLTVDEGLSHTDANDIAQDKQGYIWIATYFGLSRYDGYSVKRFYNNSTPLNNALKNRVICILPDESGNLWLGTEDGLQVFDPIRERYHEFTDEGAKMSPFVSKLIRPAGGPLYAIAQGRLLAYDSVGGQLHEEKVNMPSGVQFTNAVSDDHGNVYLSANNGLWTIVKHHQLDKVSLATLAIKPFSFVAFDKRANLLAASENIAYRISAQPLVKGRSAGIDRESRKIDFQFTCPANSFIKNIVQDENSDYWVSTSTDIFRLDSTFQLKQVINNRTSLHSLNSNSINKIFIDISGCLWVCTFGGGINFCDLNEKLFYTLQHNPEEPNSLSGNHIRSVLEDGDLLWIGTTANGLNAYNFKTGNFTFYNTHHSSVRLKNDAICSLVLDDDKNLWIGTGSGIEVLKDRKNIWHPPGEDKFPSYTIETLAIDYYGNIWFGNHTDQFGVIYKEKGNRYNVKYYGEGYYILADKDKPQVLVSSTHGLKRAIIDRNGDIIKMFDYKAGAEGSALSSNYTYPIRQQNDSTWWVGTMGGGVDRLTVHSKDDSLTAKWYRNDYGIFNDVESLEIGDDGSIWMGGNGLECLNPETGKLTKYDKNDGLQGNSFKVNSSYKGASGRLYFGGINGLNYFFPDEIKSNQIPARPVLTDITINNGKQVNDSKEFSNIPESAGLSYGSEIKLNYLQNNFVVSFSAMHFANPLKCLYRYKLMGFDKDWKYTDGQNPKAAYSNLDYDHYIFVVEASNNDGIWSKSRAEAIIIITPPWWKSPIAKTVYILLALLALSGAYIYQGRWHRLKRELEIRAVNQQRMAQVHRQREELYQQQLTFFTNISHEFRTPLSLILGPLETMMGQNKDTELDTFYQLMFRNAKRLTNLINELMNFRKVADSFIKLQVRPLDIGQFCIDLASSFYELAKAKNIQYEITGLRLSDNAAALTGLFDVQVVEKILFNLLNNSFKYTDAGGRISFELFVDLKDVSPHFETGFQILHQGHRADRYIYFRIADTGIGISSESMKNIFDRYYRVHNNHLGSGVGLSLVKSLTELHKGDIYVHSERHKGTEIIIGLPYGEKDYLASEMASNECESLPQLEKMDNYTLLPFIEQRSEANTAQAKIDRYILIVEDNVELRIFLRKRLESYYHVYEAADGNAGLALAIEHIPDLIISDVSMPGMDGIELCRYVKDSFETSHIPFIILSAKDALDTKIAGMQSGADYYFSKPLSIDLLLLTVHNIFEQNKKLKLKYVNDYLSEATELVSSEKDREFLNKLVDLIEAHIQDPGLDAAFICERLFISRTKLYQKIKSVSDQSVADFIRTIRLKKAVYIMTHEDVSINDVADRIGMLSASNFSRTFKKEFGKSPLNFIQSLKQNKT